MLRRSTSLLMAGVVLLSACATLHRTDGSLNVPLLLTDMQFSVTEACSVEWLAPDVCVLGTDILTAAQAIAAKNTNAAGVAVRQSLVDAEVRLPATSRLRPYLDVVIALLPTAP